MGAQDGRQRRLRIGQRGSDRLHAGDGTGRNRDAELAAEPAQRVDAVGAARHPLAAGAMKCLQRLLLDRLDAHVENARIVVGLQQRGAVGRIGLVAKAVRLDVRGRQQANRNALALQGACPVVRGAARLHHHLARLAVAEEALELRARQAVRTGDASARISLGHLEDRLCKIDGDGCSIHVGLLSLKT